MRTLREEPLANPNALIVIYCYFINLGIQILIFLG
jgi:hypothetical protein